MTNTGTTSSFLKFFKYQERKSVIELFHDDYSDYRHNENYIPGAPNPDLVLLEVSEERALDGIRVPRRDEPARAEQSDDESEGEKEMRRRHVAPEPPWQDPAEASRRCDFY